jgi:hypothetical protein
MKLHSKKIVARSQLEEAVMLFFERRDPVSIHTLLGASHQIMRDVARHEGIEYKCIIEMLHDKEKIKKKDWYKAVFTPRNFFKHANDDANVILDFDPLENEMWLLDACILFGQLFEDHSRAVDSYWSWYQIKHPETQAFLSTPTLVKVAELLNVKSDDFEFFREHCHKGT